MEIEITGGLTVTAIMAVIAAFITQGLKQMINHDYHKFLPFPIAAVCVTVGAGLAWLQGADPVQGGLQGFVAAALAVFGYDFVKGVISPAVAAIRSRQSGG